ncbi:aminoacyl-tRNA deacylase [Euzebya tangerina]|uniref:aminoacyl-tRNA deacylase n=1 Tax=Euzebya tangerina TaxID=591198 RepID=UPI000E316E32|nr:YbaK/EbsC family protein [Euzebya tangerina]
MTDVPGVRAAADLGLPVEVTDVGPSSSMEEHEAKLGVPTGTLCKTLVVRQAEDSYVFVVVSGGRRMAWAKLRHELGVKRASMTRRDEVEAVTGYAPGTVTVLGAAQELPVLIDRVAADHAQIAIGSGSPGVSLIVRTDAFISAVGASVVDVTESEAS